MGSSRRLSFFGGARIVFVGETRIDFVWNTKCSRIVQKLMRQLMDINGETFLAGSAPKEN